MCAMIGGYERNMYLNTAKRFGIEIDYLLAEAAERDNDDSNLLYDFLNRTGKNTGKTEINKHDRIIGILLDILEDALPIEATDEKRKEFNTEIDLLRDLFYKSFWNISDDKLFLLNEYFDIYRRIDRRTFLFYQTCMLMEGVVQNEYLSYAIQLIDDIKEVDNSSGTLQDVMSFFNMAILKIPIYKRQNGKSAEYRASLRNKLEQYSNRGALDYYNFFIEHMKEFVKLKPAQWNCLAQFKLLSISPALCEQFTLFTIDLLRERTGDNGLVIQDIDTCEELINQLLAIDILERTYLPDAEKLVDTN